MPRSRTVTTRRQPRAAGRTKRPGRRTRPTKSRAGAKPARASQAEHQDEVQAFLDEFTLLLTSGDGNGVAARFEVPAFVVMADSQYGPSQVLDGPEKAAQFFGKAPDLYHAKGIESTVPDIEELRWLGGGLGIVQVRFPYFDSDGNDLGDGETSVYLIRRTQPGDYRIVAAVALGTDSDRAKPRGKAPAGEEGEQLAQPSASD